MKFTKPIASCCLFALLAGLTGCGATDSDQDTPGSEVAADQATAGDAGGSGSKAPAIGGGISLTSENTTIQFVGNHTGDDPKPRTCTFQSFTGNLGVDGGLSSVTVEIETDSLLAEMENLTTHLKNADFFDVKRFPKASFNSTAVQAGEGSAVTITGDLTLLGQTHSLTFPATFEGGKLTASFEIDRTKWGMEYGPDKVEKMVEMTITVGG